MVTDALLALFHFLSVFATVGLLSAELALCRGAMTAARARVLFRVDLGYFIAAMAVLLSGFLRVFYGAKGAGFYFSNPVFHAKLGVYIAVAIASVPVTLAFARWNKLLRAGDRAVVAPDEVARARRWMHVEAALFALLPVLAVLMARGIGS